jgi:hypothetical protein
MKIEIEIPINRIKEILIREFGLSDLESECDLMLIAIDNDGQTSPFTYLRITN